MEDIIDIQAWAERWLNDMNQAVMNQNKGLIMVLYKENDESEIDWAEDVTPSMAREYDELIDQANDILL